MNEQLMRFLGLCRRAGRLIWGADSVNKAIRERKALLVLCTADLSANSARDIAYAAQQAGVPLCTLNGAKEELGFAIGKVCGVICVTDKGFADKILTMLHEEQITDDKGHFPPEQNPHTPHTQIRRNNHGYDD